MANKRFARDFPAATGDVVTQGHADYCEEYGHATHKIDGEVQHRCPRCGEVTQPELTVNFTPGQPVNMTGHW